MLVRGSLSKRVAACAATLVLFAVLAGCNWKGPNPTLASVSATTGPFAIAQVTVPAGNGFGGGTIYYPTDTSHGLYGGVAVVPGFISPQSSISWYGPRSRVAGIRGLHHRHQLGVRLPDAAVPGNCCTS